MLSESTTNILISGIMGILGGLVTIPINALFSFWLKRDEQLYKNRLDMIAKKQELLLQYKLENERRKKDLEFELLKKKIEQLTGEHK